MLFDEDDIEDDEEQDISWVPNGPVRTLEPTISLRSCRCRSQGSVSLFIALEDRSSLRSVAVELPTWRRHDPADFFAATCMQSGSPVPSTRAALLAGFCAEEPAFPGPCLLPGSKTHF